MVKNILKSHTKLIVMFIVFISGSSTQIFSDEDTTGTIFTKLLKFELKKDSINSVQKIFGQTKIYRDGDVSETSTRINYFFINENCYITFDSGEMGGGNIVDCFILRANNNGEDSRSVPNIVFSKTDLGGLRIGMKLIDFKRQLGNKIETENNRISKTFISTIKMTSFQIDKFNRRGINVKEYPFWDVVVNITGMFVDSTLTQLNVCKTISY